MWKTKSKLGIPKKRKLVNIRHICGVESGEKTTEAAELECISAALWSWTRQSSRFELVGKQDKWLIY